MTFVGSYLVEKFFPEPKVMLFPYTSRTSKSYVAYRGYNETTTLTSFSCCNSCGVNSTHYCHYTMMASATKMFLQSNFKILLKSFYIHLIIMFMYFSIKRLIFSQIWNALKLIFCLVYSFCIFRVSMETVSLCSVFKFNNKNVNTLSDCELSRVYLHLFTDNELEILLTARGFAEIFCSLLVNSRW